VSVEYFDRPVREPLDPVPAGKVSLPEAVPVPRVPARSMLHLIGAVVMLMLVAILIYVLFQIRQGLFSILPVMMLVMYGVMFFRRGGGNRSQNQKSSGEMEADRQDWFNQADVARKELVKAAEKQFERSWRCHPDPQDLIGLAGCSAMWQRRRFPTDDFKDFNDFGHVRLGVGTIKQGMQIDYPPLPETPMYVEPATSHGKRKFLREQPYIHDMPRVVSLTKKKALSLVGPMDEVRGLARAVMCQLSQWHSPDDLKLIVVTDRPDVWEWTKWLPHVQDSSSRDGCGERRTVFPSAREYEDYFADEISDRGQWSATAGGPRDHVAGLSTGGDSFWVVIDDACGAEVDWASAAPPNGVGGVCFIRLAESAGSGRGLGFDRKSVYRVEGGVVRRVDESLKLAPAKDEEGGMAFYADADWLGLEDAERFAQAMAPYRPGSKDASERAGGAAAGSSMLETLDIRDGRFLDTERLWAERRALSVSSKREGSSFWRFPIGVDDEGNVVEMDLKESADYGWNLNGIIVGTMGSGKSVALTAIASGLMLTHPPEVAVFALFDLKSKSIAQVLERSPHCIAAVSNLKAEKHLIRRMHLALHGLFERRKEAVTAAGCVHIREYNAKIGEGADLPLMPALQVVVDEFNELPDVYPEIFPFFDHLVRQGRAYDISLLLCGQKYDVPQLMRMIDPVLGFRIALRTGTAQVSREVINEPIAYHIPSRGAEGTGYLKVGSDTVKKIRFFNTMADHIPMAPVDERKVIEAGDWFEPREFAVTPTEDIDGRMAPPPIEVERDLVPAETGPDEKPLSETETVINAVGGPAARPLVDFWLPPLEVGLDADEMVRRLRGKPWTQDYGDTAGLSLPIGQEDCPFECTQPVVALDLRDRHWAIAGGAHSGLTTALMTAVLGGALMYRPDYVQFYCIAGAASAMMNLRSIPHVAGIASGGDVDGVLRVLDSIIELIDFRTKKFGELDITAQEFFARRAADPQDLPEIPGGQVVLVVEDFVKVKTTLTTPREDRFVARMLRISQHGLAAGVHLVLSTVTHGHAFAHQVATNVNGRVELKLGPNDTSTLNRTEAASLPAKQAGWGISPGGYRMLTGLPRLNDAHGTVVADKDGFARVFAEQVGAKRSTQMARLPERITLAELQKAAPGKVVVALRERDLSPVVWHYRHQPHLAVLGRPKSGRTTSLRSASRSVMDVLTPEQAQFHVIDLARQNMGMFPREYVASYSLTASQARKRMLELVEELQARKPPDDDDLDPETAATHRFWEGAEIFVVIDNSELLPHNSGDFPFAPAKLGAETVASLAPQGAQLGLHIMYSAQLDQQYSNVSLIHPLWRAVRQNFSPTLILDGDPMLAPVATNSVRPVAQERPGKGLWVESELVGTVLAPWTEPPELPQE
jgi:S-DNA-T family DNA segregation ATPase FtsK/SpoIIIE